MRSRNTER
jgi:hypothetical protein